jgi:hypothetical protein
MPDSETDYSDAPAIKPFPTVIHVGRFYTRRVDADDVLAWFRAQRKKYQTYINEVLRREMQARPQMSIGPLDERVRPSAKRRKLKPCRSRFAT